MEVACLVLISRSPTVQGNQLMGSANGAVGFLYAQQQKVLYYFGLGRMNDSLMKENAWLREQLALYQSFDTVRDSLVQLPLPREDSMEKIRYAHYVYRRARIMNNSVALPNNYITLNRGSDQGIQKGMAVISPEGVVGRIIKVSPHFSTALSVLSIKQQVSAQLKDGTIGYVNWEGQDPRRLIMRDIPQQIPIRKGDTVFTTHYSFFPAGVPIGVVYGRQLIAHNNLQRLYLHTCTDFRRLQYVYIVEDRLLHERRALEDSAKIAP